MPADVASASQLKSSKKSKSSKKRKEQPDSSSAAAASSTPPAVKAKKIKSATGGAAPVASATPAVAPSLVAASAPSSIATPVAAVDAASKPAKLKKKKSSSDLDQILAGVDASSKSASKKQKRKSDVAAAASSTPAAPASSSQTSAPVVPPAPAAAAATPTQAAATELSSKEKKKKDKKDKKNDKAGKQADAATPAAAAVDQSQAPFYPSLPPPPANAQPAAPPSSSTAAPNKALDKAARSAQKAREKAEKKARRKEHKERQRELERAAAVAAVQTAASEKAAKKKKSKKDKTASATPATPAQASAAAAAAPASQVSAPAAAPATPATPSAIPSLRGRGNPFLKPRAPPANAPGGFDPSQYPRGFDFAAMAGYLVESNASSSAAAAGTSGSPAAATEGEAAAAPAPASPASDREESPEQLLAKINAVISAPGYVAPKSRLSLPARRPMPGKEGPKVRARVSKGDRAPTKGANSKEETIADARGLSHVDMLATKLYQPKQLKWLKEEYGLDWKAGKYDKSDDAKIDKAIEKFAASNNMEEEDVRAMIVARDPDQAELYADLFVEISTALGDRPNRSVRKHVIDREERSNRGAWNSEEEAALDTAVAMHQKDWKRISQEVGRPAANCRSHYALTRGVEYNRGPWSDVETKAFLASVEHFTKGEEIPSKDVPWQAVAERMGTRSALQCNKKWLEIQRGGVALRWLSARDDPEFIKRIKADAVAMKKNDDSAIQFDKMFDDKSFPYSRKTLHDRWGRIKKAMLKDHDASKMKLKEMLKIIEPSVKEKYDEWVKEGSKLTVSSSSKLDKEREEDTIDSDEEMESFSQPTTPSRPRPKPRAAAAAVAAKDKGKGKAKEVEGESEEDEEEKGSEEEGSSDEESSSDDSLGSSD